MAVSPQWKFILANSSDLSQVGELQHATGKSLSLVFNRPGSCNFTLPMSDDMAPLIWPITSAIKIYRSGSDGAWQLIWSGMVWNVEEDVTGNKMTVTAQGWLQWLDKRVLRRSKDYTGAHPSRTGLLTTDPARYWRDQEIVYDLLADANTSVISWDLNYTIPTPYSSGSPATAKPTPLGPGVASGDFTTHGRQYSIDKYATILGEIQKLTDIENGCDVWVNPSTRLLYVYAQKMTVRTRAIFGYGQSDDSLTPNNLSQFGRSIDPSTVVNRFDASGQDSTIQPRFADTQSFGAPGTPMPSLGQNSQTSYGLVEEATSISDAKTTESLATYAAAEVLLRSSPRLIYSMTPFPYTTDLGPGRIPEPFVDYDLGDRIYVTADAYKRISIVRQAMRIFGITVNPDESGNEVIGQLQVTPG